MIYRNLTRAQLCSCIVLLLVGLAFLGHNGVLLWYASRPEPAWLGASMGALTAQLGCTAIVGLLIPRLGSTKVLFTLLVMPVPVISFTWYAARTGAGPVICTSIAIWMIVAWTLFAVPLIYYQRRFGLRLCWSERRAVGDIRATQFGIREILIGTTIIGVLLGISRALFSTDMSPSGGGRAEIEFVKLLVLITIFNTMACYTIIFAAFRPNRTTLWLLGAISVSFLLLGIELLLCSWAKVFSGRFTWLLLLAMHLSQIVFVTCWIVMLRGAGFRLVKGKN